MGHLTPSCRRAQEGSVGVCRAHTRHGNLSGRGPHEPARSEQMGTTIMTTQLSHHRSRHWMATGIAGARLGRLATVLAAVISGLLASAVAATAAFANPIPIGDAGSVPITPVPPATIRVISTGGMVGWQVALIAVGAALVAAAAAVLVDRKLAGRRGVTATAA